MKKKHNLLLGICSGIGAKDSLELIENLAENYNLKIIVTEKSNNFFDCNTAKEKYEVFGDEDEWYQWEKRGDDVLHISLRNWADIFLIAPLSANTLAKLCSGISDNLLTTTARAWKFKQRSFFIAPSMNKFMWDHPLTKQHLSIVEGWGVKQIPPRVKMLAGGDFGTGALQKSDVMVKYIDEEIQECRQ